MNLRLIIITLFLFMGAVGTLYASEGHDHGEHGEAVIEEDKGAVMKEKDEMPKELEATEGIVNIGNKICPVSGEEIGSMGEGIQVEHQGKIYNLCCRMCAKDFKKNPEKFIEKINEEMEANSDKHHEEEHDTEILDEDELESIGHDHSSHDH